MQSTLSKESDAIVNPPPDSSCCQSELVNFHTVSTNEVSKYLVSSSLKTCDLDPLLSILFRECLDVLLLVITKIVNLSLTTRHVPHHFKEAMVRPKLKKESLDHEQFPHFRPISNLKFQRSPKKLSLISSLTTLTTMAYGKIVNLLIK